MTYSEQLLHPLWQRKRLEILQRDNFKCQLCQDTEKTLHVHHKFYEPGKKAWDYPTEYLTILCCDCHEKEEAYKEFIQPEIKRLMLLGSSNRSILSLLLKERIRIEGILKKKLATSFTDSPLSGL